MADDTLAESFEHRGCTIKIHYDQTAASPRTFDCTATTMAFSHRRYDLPNEIGFDPDVFDLQRVAETSGHADARAEIEAYIRENYDVVAFTWVRGYDHGALHLSTSTAGQMSDPWDSGIAGFMFVTREQQAAAGTPDDQLNALMDEELDLYDKWANGENYGYVVTSPDGTNIDSCWGFVGGDLEFCKQQAVEAADWWADEKAEKDATEAAMAQLPVVLNAGDDE